MSYALSCPCNSMHNFLLCLNTSQLSVGAVTVRCHCCRWKTLCALWNARASPFVLFSPLSLLLLHSLVFLPQIHLSHQSLVLTPGSTEHNRFGRRNIWTTKIWHKPEQQQGKVDRKQAQWPNSTVAKGCASNGAPCKTVLKLPVIYTLGWYGNCNETLLGRSFHLNEWLNTFQRGFALLDVTFCKYETHVGNT